MEKLYSTLKERYKERYGNFVRITRIPNPTTSPYPNMAYAEFVGNSLPPLPKLPVVKEGRWIIYGREDDNDDELVEKSVAVQRKSLLR